MTTDEFAQGDPSGFENGPGTHFSSAPEHSHSFNVGGLRRAREGRLLGGVAAGAAAYFDLDVTIVRIAIAFLALLGGVGVPLYIAAWLLIPEVGTDRCMLADLLTPIHSA